MVTFKKPYIRAAKKKKIAIMKAMKDNGIPTAIIAEKMGVSKITVQRYTNLELDGKWLDFENAVKKVYMEQDFDLSQDLYKELKGKMAKASFRDLSEFFRTIRTVNQTKAPPPNLQQTNIKFEITDGTKPPTVIKAEEVKENG